MFFMLINIMRTTKYVEDNEDDGNATMPRHENDKMALCTC